jgi:hypothetical protein
VSLFIVLKAMSKQHFDHIVKIVNQGRYSLTDEAWTGALDYLMNDLKFRLEPAERAKFHEQAIDHIKANLNEIIKDHSIPGDAPENKNAFAQWTDIHFKQGYYFSEELKEIATPIRQRLVLADYIKSNVLK